MKNEDLEEIRQAIKAARSRSPGRFGHELRQQIIEHVARKRVEGETVRHALAPFSLSTSVYFGWLQNKAKSPPVSARFLPVRVAAERSERKAACVYGPSGMRIEGLSVDEMAELIKRLDA